MPPSEPTESAPPPPSDLARRVLLTIFVGGAILGLGFGGSYALTLMKEEPSRAKRPRVRTAVRVEAARHGAHRELLTGYGRARALRRADVPAEIAATVVWISPNLDAGRRVRAGEELVRLDPRDAEAQTRVAEARLAQADAKLLRAKSDEASLAAQESVAQRELDASRRELERLLDLVSKATSESEVDSQRMAVAFREQSVIGLVGRRAAADADGRAAKAEANAARAQLEIARHDLARAVVRAPYDGSIVARSAQLGERVAAGAALFSIVDLGHVEVPVSLPASRHGEVAVGAKAVLRLHEGGDAVWTGTVTRLAPAVDTERRTFDAFLDIVGEQGGKPAPVAPGSFAVVTIEGRVTENVVVVPREAYVADALYVAEPIGAPDKKTGAREAVVHELRPEVVRRLPDVVLVRDGLPDGSLVIVTSVDQVADGARVLLLPEDDGGDAADGAE